MNNSPTQECDVPVNGSSWLLTGVTAAATLCLNLLYGFVVPSFRAMFNDFGAQLPRFSQVIIVIPPIAWIAIGVSLSAAILLKNLLFHERFCFLVDVVSLIGCGISLLVVIVVLFVPLSGIVQSIK